MTKTEENRVAWPDDICGYIGSFAAVMQVKLNGNDYKGGWHDCDMGYLLRRAMEEFGEVLEALDSRADHGDVTRECADVANFMMMIADRYEFSDMK